MSNQMVKVLDNIEEPGWLREVLLIGSKQRIKDKIKETHFWADMTLSSQN